MTPCVARALRVALKNTVEPQDDLTPAESEAFLITDLSPSDSSSEEEDSNGENAYDSLTSTLLPVVLLLLIYSQQRPVPILHIALLKVNSVLLCHIKKTLVRCPVRYLQKLQL